MMFTYQGYQGFQGYQFSAANNLPKNAKIVPMNQAGSIVNPQKGHGIATFGLDGCYAIIVASPNAAFLAHYSELHDLYVNVGVLSDAKKKVEENLKEEVKGFLIAPGTSEVPTFRHSDLEVEENHKLKGFRSVMIDLFPGVESKSVPYLTQPHLGDMLHGTVTVMFEKPGEMPTIRVDGLKIE